MDGNCAITSFFRPSRPAATVGDPAAAQKKKKLVLIMDEVDGMAGGDICICTYMYMNMILPVDIYMYIYMYMFLSTFV